MAIENWNEEIKMPALEYLENATLNEYASDLVTGWIREGETNPRSQRRVTSMIKEILNQNDDSPFKADRSGSRTYTLPAAVREEMNAVASVEDGQIALSEDAHTYFRTYYGRTNSDGTKKTSWDNNEELLNTLLLSKIQQSFISDYKESLAEEN